MVNLQPRLPHQLTFFPVETQLQSQSTTALISEDIRAQIVEIINSIWDVGLMVGMQKLPSLISVRV
jgi:hypothetical protein